jgi:glycosyltransferase involved in cell wall biosynthesis
MSSDKTDSVLDRPVAVRHLGALPKISIITPSFNQGNFLEETILSVITQEYPNYELLIIDGGSVDNTSDVINKYKDYITYWVSEKDRGQSHAIQKGLERVTGDIVNWINSDDLLAPGALYAIAREFDLSRFDVLCGYCDYFINTLDKLDKRNERMKLFDTVGHTLLNVHINQPSTFFKTSVLKALSVDEQFRYTMDVDLWYRFLLEKGHQKVQFSDSLLSYFRLHDKSKTVAENPYFLDEIHRVFYNIAKALNLSPVIINYLLTNVQSSNNFSPRPYVIGVPREELREFIRGVAWAGLAHYNSAGNKKAARECLSIAYNHGQQISNVFLRQVVRQYLMPSFFISKRLSEKY